MDLQPPAQTCVRFLDFIRIDESAPRGDESSYAGPIRRSRAWPEKSSPRGNEPPPCRFPASLSTRFARPARRFALPARTSTILPSPRNAQGASNSHPRASSRGGESGGVESGRVESGRVESGRGRAGRHRGASSLSASRHPEGDPLDRLQIDQNIRRACHQSEGTGRRHDGARRAGG